MAISKTPERDAAIVDMTQIGMDLLAALERLRPHISNTATLRLATGIQFIANELDRIANEPLIGD